jgi:hypothetical protein
LPYICLVRGLIKIDAFVQSMSSSVVYRYSDNETIPLLFQKVQCYNHKSLQFDPFLIQFS